MKSESAPRCRASAAVGAAVEDIVLECVRSGERITVALSGGVDSVVLLHALRALQPRLGFRLDAQHVNHRISPHADHWQRFCENLCRDWGVALAAREISVRRGGGPGLEARARALRYAIWAGVEADWIALAHHRDDQAETVLHNLLRGAGVRGAAGMPWTRPLGTRAPALIRPLLGVSRTEIEAYARHAGLRWIEDESNLDRAYARNFLRHDILPRLEERFPGCSAALARTAGHCGETEQMLEELAAVDLAAAGHGESLDVDILRRLSSARARNLLRYWLRRSEVLLPDAAALHEVLRQALATAGDRQMQVRIGRHSVRRFAGHLHIVPIVPSPAAAELRWNGEAELAWGAGSVRFARTLGQGISAAALERGAVWLRRRAGGERIRMKSGSPRRTLKNLFQERGVPPWQREIMPLLWCGSELAWVPELGAAADYRCPAGDPGWLVTWTP